MKDKLIGILGEITSLDGIDVNESSHLFNDIGLSSLRFLTFMIRCDKAFNIGINKLDNSTLVNIATVGNVLDIIKLSASKQTEILQS